MDGNFVLMTEQGAKDGSTEQREEPGKPRRNTALAADTEECSGEEKKGLLGAWRRPEADKLRLDFARLSWERKEEDRRSRGSSGIPL